LTTHPSTIRKVTPAESESQKSLQNQNGRSSELKKETGNLRSKALKVRSQLKPDLVPLQLILNKETVFTGEKMIFQVMVKNNGGDSLEDVSLAFLLDGRQVGLEKINIAAHATKPVVFRHVARKIGKHVFSVQLDPENRLDETNERNNEKASQFTVVRKEAVAIQPQKNIVPSNAKVGKQGTLLPLKVEKENKNLVPQGGGVFDLSCSLPLQQGVHIVDPKNPFVMVKVQNNGVQNAAAFYVGLGKKNTAKIGNGTSWLNLHQVVAGGIPSGKWIYVHLKVPAGINENTDLVVAVDSNGDIQEKDESNNLSKPFRIQYKEAKQPSPPSKTADLVVFPETKDGVYYGEGKGVSVKVVNIGSSDAPSCTIGIGFSDQVENGGKIKWAGKATVPKIFSKQHVYVTVPGQFQVLPKDSVYTVAIDIDDVVDEQGGENNNLSKSFSYEISQSKMGILLPQDKPFEAFDIKQPQKGAHLLAGSDLQISWYPTTALNNSLPEVKSRYWEIDIALVDPATNKVMAMLAKNVNNRPVHGSHSWNVILPDLVGDYRIRFSSRQGNGWGQSGIFSLYEGKVAQAKPMFKVNEGVQTIPAEEVDKAILSASESDSKALSFKFFQIKSITPKTVVLKGGLGPYARLTSINVVVEYESNKPFRLTPSLTPPENLKPDSVWSLAVPMVEVEGCLADANELNYQIGSHLHSGCAGGDPVTNQYPWKSIFKIGSGPKRLKYPEGILPQGKNTLTLVMEEAGVAHGLEIVGQARKLVDYQQGVITKHKWVYAKCSRKFYPYFNVYVGLRTYHGVDNTSGDWSSSSYQETYGFKVPPVWQRLDPWENAYFDKNQTATGIPTYFPEECTFE
jgi:hypothetical protein